MSEAKPKTISLNLEVNYLEVCEPLLKEPNPYRRLMRRLSYLNFSRPNMSYAINYLSQFMHRPCKLHIEGALQILAYLKGSIYISYGMLY